MDERYDVVVIGTGAGGATVAHALAQTGARLLVLERGGDIPREPENRDPASVWQDLRYRANETWFGADGEPFQPYTHYCVGGNTKFWGSVLYRLRREDFGEIDHGDGVSPAWPISYDTLAPYYERAEQLYQVHGSVGEDPTEPVRGPFPHPAVPHEEGIAHYVERIRQLGLHPSALPLGLRGPGESNGCILCNTCNSFPCERDTKSDADVTCVRPIRALSNVTLQTNARAKRLLTDPAGRRVEAVEVDINGVTRRFEGATFVVSCGAVNSAALLLRSQSDCHPQGLANSSGLVGRRYMAHLATMLQGFHPFRRNDVVFQKTVAINDFYLRGPGAGPPLGQIQSQGRTHGVMAQTAYPWVPVPLWAYNAWVARGVDWLAMTEDLPRFENRVTLDANGHVRLTYRPNNQRAHAGLVREVRRMLKRLGFWVVMAFSHKEKNTTHQCGTVVFGTDPQQSVLDPYCRTHDVENLFVVDASFFPSSAAVNPGLTIIAQALRVADHLRATDLGLGDEATRSAGDG